MLGTIINGGREFNNQTGEGLWIQIVKDLVQIPYLESDITTQTKFVKQNCFVRMGKKLEILSRFELENFRTLASQ